MSTFKNCSCVTKSVQKGPIDLKAVYLAGRAKHFRITADPPSFKEDLRPQHGRIYQETTWTKKCFTEEKGDIQKKAVSQKKRSINHQKEKLFRTQFVTSTVQALNSDKPRYRKYLEIFIGESFSIDTPATGTIAFRKITT